MRKGMITNEVAKGSIAQELGLQKGDEIVSINGEKPKDIIDYSFLVQNEFLDLEIKHKSGERGIFEIEKDFEEDLGITFESAVFDGVKPCCNHCIFCFVDQQPKGLRKSLYIKDDDWRMSYLQGTYITLTNFTKYDWERLATLRISPLYVSIHTTNPLLREKMLRNKKAGEILNNLEKLKKIGIEIHGQIVLCPDYNDGVELKRTLEDLKKFKKILKSLAVVPIGISKYRKEKLKSVDKKIALETIKIIEQFNKDIKKNVAMASDEFFILAGCEFPPRKYYGKFLQIEDGVGTTRLFLDDMAKKIKKVKKEFKKNVKLTFLVSKSAIPLFKKIKKEIKVKNLEIEILPVKNRFFGEKITVAGLMTGQDIIDTIRNKKLENVVIPSLVFREGTEEFLDGKTLNDIKSVTDAKIFINKECYNFSDILTIINSL